MKPRFQFRLRTLMVVVTAVAVILGTIRWLGPQSVYDDDRASILSIILVAETVTAAWITGNM
jgi:hypothetical protein